MATHNVREPALTIRKVLLFLIENGPGRTQVELAQAIFGERAYQQRVNQDCYALARMELVKQRGDGGQHDPFRYYPVKGKQRSNQ
jgi:hypothetical protein